MVQCISVYESQGLFCVALRTEAMIGPTLINNVSTFLAGLELAIIPGLLLILAPSVFNLLRGQAFCLLPFVSWTAGRTC